MYSEGAVSPLAEADPLLRRLIETELEDVERRREILSDPEFIEAFRTMWSRGKSGFNLGYLRRKLRLEKGVSDPRSQRHADLSVQDRLLAGPDHGVDLSPLQRVVYQ